MRELIRKIDAAVSGRGFFPILGIVILAGLILRVLFLSADAPSGFTRSQDFSTDPFQYVYFAKNSVEVGDSNPYDDPRFTGWEKSTMNLVSWLTFNVIGTGRAEGNAVAVIFNLASILLLALAIRRFGSPLAAIIFAIIASFDYALLWFARTPFLEAAQNFWLCAAVYFFALAQKRPTHFVFAGIACGAAAFFGKMIALFMLGAFGLLAIAQWLSLEDRKPIIQGGVRFAIGFAIAALAWLFYIYLPSRGELGGYLAEQALGLYGAPKALESPNQFVWYLVTLLFDQLYFFRTPIVTLLAFVAGAGILRQLAARNGKYVLGRVDPGWLLIFFWFAVGYLSLFPWNYRPLRYQTTLMFPAMALAALALEKLLIWARRERASGKKSAAPEYRGALIAAFWGLWLLPALALIVMSVGGSVGSDLYQSIKSSAFVAGLAMAGAGALLGLLVNAVAATFNRQAVLGGAIGLTVLAVMVVWGVTQFVVWSGERQYSLITADRDLGVVLNPGAVISGSYATAFTQENRWGCIPHMFGVVRVDQDFFRKFPITHLAIDEGNEQRARQDYPDVMNKAQFVTRYLVRGINDRAPLVVRIFRVSEGTPNADAARYQPSDYERAMSFGAAGQNDSAQFMLQRFLGAHPENYSANLTAGDALHSGQQLEAARDAYAAVQRFSPGDPLSAYNLGTIYMSLAASHQQSTFFDSALVYFKAARPAFGRDQRLLDYIQQLERRKS